MAFFPYSSNHQIVSRTPVYFYLLDVLNIWGTRISHGLLLGNWSLGWLLVLLCPLGGGTLGSPLGILGSLLSLPLLLDLVEVSLGNWTSNGADLIDLGNVDGLGGVLTLLVKPILQD